VLAEVALEANAANVLVPGVQLLDDAPGTVCGAVVDEDELVRPAARLERGDRLAVGLLERALLVVDGDDERDGRERPLLEARGNP
jgi:hypothetical protein